MKGTHKVNSAAFKKKLVDVYLDAVKKSKNEATAEEQAISLANAIADAVADFIGNTKVQVDITILPSSIAPPATIICAGPTGPAPNTTPVPMNPVSLPPTFGSVV